MNVTLTTIGEPVDFTTLRQAIEWEQRSVTVFGKTHPQPRLTRWYGDVPYVYSGLSWEPAPMPPLVDTIRQKVETIAGERFNSVLCNLYRHGGDSVGWHADDEPIFGGDPIVASVSFGATRTFKVRPNKDRSQHDATSFSLTDGSLLIMGRGIQKHYKHCIPETAQKVGERINLTFRLTV